MIFIFRLILIAFATYTATPDSGSVRRVDYNGSKRKPFHTFLSAILFLAAIVKLVYGELGETRSGQNQSSVLR